MSNPSLLREEEIQAIMRLPANLRTSFLHALVAESVPPPIQAPPPPQDPEPPVTVDQRDTTAVPTQDGPAAPPHIDEGSIIPPHTPSTPPGENLRPPKRKRVESPRAPLPPPGSRHDGGGNADGSTPPPQPIDPQNPCSRCFIKGKKCVPGRTLLRCNECYERHRKCIPRRPDDVPERPRTPSPTPATPRASKSRPAATRAAALISHTINTTEHSQSPEVVDPVVTPALDEISRKITSLQGDFAAAIAEQKDVNMAILRALHCLIERTETNGKKEGV